MNKSGSIQLSLSLIMSAINLIVVLIKFSKTSGQKQYISVSFQNSGLLFLIDSCSIPITMREEKRRSLKTF